MSASISVRFNLQVKKLFEEFGRDYLLFALRKISERQMLFLSIPHTNADFQPILKVLDIIINELESELFSDASELPEQDLSDYFAAILRNAIDQFPNSSIEHSI